MMQTKSTVITVSRARLYPVVALPGPTWRWTYAYEVEGDPVVKQYGTGLASLRSMLKCHFPGCTIVESWKAGAR